MLPKLLIYPDVESQRQAVDKLLDKLGIKSNNPEVMILDNDSKSFGVEDTKKIKDHFFLKGDGTKTAILIGADKLTADAQNSLLKILEETPGEGLLILTASSEHNFLPTILSRCEVIESEYTSNKTQVTSNIEALLQSDVKTRFITLEGIEDKEGLLDQLNTYYTEKLKSNPNLHSSAKLVLEANKWKEANVNIRAILEYLLLTIKA